MKKFSYDGLNEAQKKAVAINDGPVLVSAGAGTGKTSVLTKRVSRLILDGVARPEQILAITFTNKATREMKERIESTCGHNGSGVLVSTFHSFCVKVLREFISYLKPTIDGKYAYNKFFTICDDDDRKKIIKKVVKEHFSETDKEIEKQLNWAISTAKNEGITPKEYLEQVRSEPFKDFVKMYAAYEEHLEKSNSLDFDDLIIKTLKLLNQNAQVLHVLQNRFKYILVDEFQDTNKTQYDLILMLADVHQNIFIVGDEDQSIYSFRGARYQNLHAFLEHFPNVKIVRLEENYRSTKTILDYANCLIKKNSARLDKVLFTSQVHSGSVSSRMYLTDYEEARDVAIRIRHLLDNGKRPKDICVLFRINALTARLEQSFMEEQIAYEIYGGFKFFERAEIKNILAYFRLFVNNRDDQAVERVINFPKRGVGDKAVENAYNQARVEGVSILDYVLSVDDKYKNKGVVEFKHLILSLRKECEKKNLIETAKAIVDNLRLDKTEYKDKTEEDVSRLLNIKTLLSQVNDFYEQNQDATLADFLEAVMLNEEQQKEGEEIREKVVMASVHQAKGLEFDTVFIIGVEENMFPFYKAIDEGNLEEERRLMYVAITRAKNTLTLSYTKNRFSFGVGGGMIQPSRFFREMDMPVEENNFETNAFGGASWQNRARFTERDGTKSYGKRPQHFEPFIDNAPKQKTGSGLSMLNIAKASDMQSKQTTKFEIGDKVEHPRFGKGIVVSIAAGTSNVTIKFEDGKIKELNLAFAPITKL